MRVACLQIAPKLGAVAENIASAEERLVGAKDGDVELLVLPEMAFSGYNFPSLEAISSHLEPTASGPSTTWAKETARRLNCVVVVGYPETSTVESERLLPHSSRRPLESSDSSPKHFNSTVTVSPSGGVLAHYRKSFLYYTDENWASEGSGFFAGGLPLSTDPASDMRIQNGDSNSPREIMKTAMGICMDINNYRFTAPWTDYEFANHVLSSECSLVVLSNAWLSHDLTPEDLVDAGGKQPDLRTLSYWVERLKPVVEGKRKIVCVVANRTGIEGGGESSVGNAEEARYAGTSCVMKVGKGLVRIWGILGKGEKGLLIVDTDEEPKYVLRTRSQDEGT